MSVDSPNAAATYYELLLKQTRPHLRAKHVRSMVAKCGEASILFLFRLIAEDPAPAVVQTAMEELKTLSVGHSITLSMSRGKYSLEYLGEVYETEIVQNDEGEARVSLRKKTEREQVQEGGLAGAAHQEFEDVIREFFAAAKTSLTKLKPLLQTVLVDNPPASLVRKREVVRQVNILLEASYEAIAHPESGEPCTLVVQTGKGWEDGVYYLNPLSAGKDEPSGKKVRLEGEIRYTTYARRVRGAASLP